MHHGYMSNNTLTNTPANNTPANNSPATDYNTSWAVPALGQLLKTWNNHQELRATGATPAELWNSRAELDQVRLEVRLAA